MERHSTVQASASRVGFEVRFHLTDGLDEAGALELWEDFFAGPVRGRGLDCVDRPQITPGLARVLYRPEASATEEDRRAVREWARRRGEIADYDIGPLTSAEA